MHCFTERVERPRRFWLMLLREKPPTMVALKYTLEAGEQRLLGLQFFVGHTWMAFQVHKAKRSGF